METSRIRCVDALRGLVMIIMALDHVRDFIHTSAQSFAPEDLTRTTPLLFFTRWITHFCAPTFMFTAGIGAFLWLRKGRTKSQLSRFLWSRGLWLILLELTAMRFALGFNFTYIPVILLVLWALGGSMIGLGFLVRLPIRVLAVLSVLVIALHNLFDRVNAAQFGSMAWLWNVIHQPGAFKVAGELVFVAYPLVPWIFVMAAGFCFGQVVVMDEQPRRLWMMRIGAGLTLAFVVIRAADIYGDPRHWSGSILSFLNCVKYPPSLDFLLMTLGPSILAMGWLDRFRFDARNPLMVFGRVPLFFFVLHFYAIHLVAMAMAYFRYGHAEFMLNPVPSMGGAKDLFPPDYGWNLGVVYLVWIGIVLAFYPLCRWFAGLKQRRQNWWLSYL